MSDFANRIEQAKQILPLRRLMEQYGKSPGNGHWKSFPKCPYCGKKGGAGTFGEGSEERFKCHHTGCPTGTAGDGKAWDAIGFLAYEHALSRKDAAVAYLKQAGLWQEREPSPSIMPGKGGRKNKLPSEVNAKDLASAAVASDAPQCNSEDGGLASQAVVGPSADAALPVVDPPRAGQSDQVAGGTDRAGEETTAGTGGAANLSGDLLPRPSESPSETHQTGAVIGDASLEPPASKLPAADAPTAAGTSPQSNIVTMTGQPVEQPAATAPGGYVVELPAGTQVLHEFFTRLTLSEADEKLLFEKRGLDSRTSKALQFKSNPKANKEILAALSSEFPWDDLYAAGLWLREDRKSKKERRPNAKFYGFGIAGKKANGSSPDGATWDYKWNNPIIIPYFDETGRLLSLRPHKDMGPGGTLTGTPHIYIPRSPGAPPKPEIFETVVITEGEFKGGALWQIIGAGRDDGKTPVGVAALPGISFGKNYETREELDGWLRRVKCRCVKVIYDNEEKGDPRFKEAYKSDRRKRFDAQIWARYLATDIAQKLHIRGEVGVLPNDWRNEKGKADWDGAMAQFARAAA